MKPSKINGVFQKGNKLFTINPPNCKNIKVYGEALRTFKGMQYRSWNPYRSKLASALTKKDISLPFESSTSVLYLGAASGTTVSHLSDICSEGYIYAVEPSPVVAKTLLKLVKQRNNIIPIIEDANHPDRYTHMVSEVDFIYQDISQRNQAEIFAKNSKLFLKENSEGVIMVKARSIDVAMKPSNAFLMVENQLKEEGMHINELIELSPFEKDHAAIFISSNK
ncbi:fibrillarin [Thermoplasmatales archaeon ex4572_165]|nr:MAG: fibrillarin [Thermoplasmatales archaeon ex4572_165]RLF58970.1 MAG: fibrillarin-like rRNA/tRNA 2'-O-methyltransferase [Thermoplasmata archaeon]